jgi:SAM-dependent methyltransferase
MTSTTTRLRTDEALRAYEAMAPAYDDFTAEYDDEFWLGNLLGILEDHGLAGRRLLDVACGTGNSFLPILSRGWTVSGCDISPAMLALATEKAGDSASLSVADMRQLPRIGEFDLVWALLDAINYLLSVEELEETLCGMRSNLADSGLLLFDLNQLLVYETFYAETIGIERGDRRLIWRGQGSVNSAEGPIFNARFEVEPIAAQGAGDDGATPVSIHRQRHFSQAEVLAAFERAGLQLLGLYGHGLDGVPVQPLDTSVHTKAIYIASRA